LYAADVKTFAAVAASGARPRCFLYVGRLVQEKGIANLIDGYSIYRSSSTKPWDLIVVGTGPMADRVTNVPGVKYLGFIEPNALPAVFRDAGCLLLPSLWEPWGVVVHEAAAAGLPVICTHACGASTAFVRDGMNGAVIATTASALATALTEFTGKTAEERNAMSAYGRALAALWTPAMEAKYLVSSVRSRLGRSVGAVSASPQR
jgi:glycosyltransferase involved in cell wall biosynthesis